jgi:cyclohexyl-isocyanide hydratase
MVVFPELTQLDLTGPYEVFCRMSDAEVLLIGAALSPMRSEFGLTFTPDVTFTDSPQLDVLFVPGGRGISDAMQSQPLLDFLRRQAATASYVTSVCTGALVLGAAGLLEGYRATTHWLSHDLLAPLGAIPVDERVVVDRNRITGGGVTAGIDFALRVVAHLRGDRAAQEIQLTIEYDPAPPFQAGSPKVAPRDLVEELTAKRRKVQDERRKLIQRITRKP